MRLHDLAAILVRNSIMMRVLVRLAFLFSVLMHSASVASAQTLTYGPVTQKWAEGPGWSITSTVTLSISGGTAYWNVSHVQVNYHPVNQGSFDVGIGGVTVVRYDSHNVYNQVQSGSHPINPGESIVVLFAELTLPAVSGQSIVLSRLPGQAAPMAGVAEGWEVSGRANGAELVVVDVVGGNVMVNQSTGVLSVTPTGAGAYSFGVYAKATATHSQSATVTGAGTAGAYELNWSFDVANPSNMGVEYRVVQGGNVLKQGVLPANFVGKISGTSPSAAPPVELQYRTSGFVYDGEVWRYVDPNEGEPEWETAQKTEATETATTQNATAVIQAGKVGNQTGTGSTVWHRVSEGNKSDPLTIGVYAEGTAKLEDALRSQAQDMRNAVQGLDAAADKIEGAASSIEGAAGALADAAGMMGGLAVDMERTADATESTRDNTREIADKINEITEDLTPDFRTNLRNARELFTGGGQQLANEALGAGTYAAETGESRMASALIEKMGPAPSLPNVTIPGGPSGGILLKVSDSEAVLIPRNPFAANGPFNGVLADYAGIVKAFIAWGIVVTFYIWAIGQMNEATKSFFWVTPFSKSLEDSANSIKIFGLGGGLGYAVRLVALLVVLPLVLTLPLALLTAVTTNLPIAQIMAIIAAGAPSLSGTHEVIQDAAGISDAIFPWAVVIGAPVWYVIVRFAILPSQFFWMMFAKFIPL